MLLVYINYTDPTGEIILQYIFNMDVGSSHRPLSKSEFFFLLPRVGPTTESALLKNQNVKFMSKFVQKSDP